MNEHRNFEQPDERRDFDHGHLAVVTVAGQKVGRATFAPGWRWSDCVKPLVGTASCEVEHLGYVVSGRMALRYDDGSTGEVGPGDFAHMPAGHDAWIIGDEEFVFVDLMGAPTYARPQ